jgi:hypothetical protein
MLKPDVAPVGITQILETANKRVEVWLFFTWVTGMP